ncbi:MAG: RHS repeat protein [Gemmatimonadetes bacterium]|nr:RHS repeat protein [Gemmatimonadota bacterium]
MTRITNPSGDYTEFGISTTNGNRLWQQDNRGLPSRTTFSYNGNNQVEVVVAPDGSDEGYFYDAKGNLNRYDNQLDQTTLYTNNANTGLTTTTLIPTGTNAGGTPRENTTLTYTERNDVLSSVTTAAGGGGTKTIANVYDAEDNVQSVARSWTPNPQNIAVQTTSYVYDNADRAVSQSESTGGAQYTSYDAAGNVTGVTLRSGGSMTMSYDVLNRLISRSISGPTAYNYPTPNITPVTGVENGPYNYSASSESQSFTHHATNQVLTATGLDADIARSYHSSGALMSETRWSRLVPARGRPHLLAELRLRHQRPPHQPAAEPDHVVHGLGHELEPHLVGVRSPGHGYRRQFLQLHL